MKKLTQTMLVLLGSTVFTAANVSAGEKALTDEKGMTLYTFDKDANGVSVCYGPCAAKWPPFLAGDSAKAKKDWSTTTRKDGSKQWMYNNKPLYTWIKDKKPGDATGDGVKGVWHTATKSGHKKQSSYGSSDY